MRTIKGYVDSISEAGVITGWALDEASPFESLSLRLTIDGVPVGDFVCSAERPDLLQAGLQTEAAGFTYTVGPEFLDGCEHQIGFLDPETLEPVLTECACSVHFAKLSRGQVKLIGREKVEGWLNTAGLGKRRLLVVEVVVDGKPFTVFSLRPDQAIEGRVPFSQDLPVEITKSPDTHEIAVRLAGTDDYLSGSPLLAQPPKPIGNFDQLIGSSVQGWALNAQIGGLQILDVFCDDAWVLQVRCDLQRQDVYDTHGERAAGFNAQIPISAVSPSSRKVDIRFADGTPLSGSPKFFGPMDRDLAELERILFGGATLSENTDRASPYDREISIIAKILAAPLAEADSKRYRARTIELAHEIITRALFSCEPVDAVNVLVALSMLGVNVCRNAEDFLSILPVIQKLPASSPLGLGLIELERQRRRPFNRLMLAGLLLSHGREDEAIDVVFEAFWATEKKTRDSIAQLGAGMLSRAGFASNAQELLFASLTK